MRILQLCYEYPPIGGGAASVVYGLSNELARIGHEVDLITMGFGKLPCFEQKGGVSVYRIPCLRTKVDICYLPELILYPLFFFLNNLLYQKKNNYDIIHAHFTIPDGFIAWFLAKWLDIPFIITAHGSDIPGYNPDRFTLAHKLLIPVWKIVVSSSRKIICPSKFLEKLVKIASPRSKTRIIPNGFNTQRFIPAPAKQDRILLVTRMFKRKGVQYFLRALSELDLDNEIIIVGDGPYLGKLKALAKDQPNLVKFVGHLDNRSTELKLLLETSKIFVFLSEAENFPNVLLEAMAAGLSIITTKDTGCAEVVQDAALLVKAGDVDGLRAALLKLVRNPKIVDHMGKLARKRLEENYGWNIIAGEYVMEYEKAIENTCHPKVA